MVAGTTALTATAGVAANPGYSGDFNAGGQPGDQGVRLNATSGWAGCGGSTQFGGGGVPTVTEGPGAAGVGNGGGGAGARTSGVAGISAGGAGAPGLVIVEFYTS